jgi:pilus assembly protein CpaC
MGDSVLARLPFEFFPEEMRLTLGRLPRPVGLLLAALCGALWLSASGPASADQVSLLSVSTGHSLILETPGLTRVAVGDGRIAGVVPIGTSQIVINGKGPGHTSIFVWTDDGRRTTYEVTVTEQSLDDIARMLRTAINLPDVQVISFGKSIILRGTVEDGQQFQRLNEIVSRFSGLVAQGSFSGTATVVNAVTVTRPLGALQAELSSIPGASDIRLDPDGKGNVILSGTVRDQVDEERLLNRARGLSGAYLSADGRVIDRLTTESNSQISIKTYVLEVDKSGLSQLGVALGSTYLAAGGDASSVTSIQGPQFNFFEYPGTSTVPGGALKVGAWARSSLLAATLSLLIESGHSRILASPNLVTTPGKNATFLVGGSVAIPLNAGNGATSVVFQPYGVQLNVTPTILGNGGIETKIEPEVSELDYANGTSVSGTTVPGLKISRLSTDVITHSGESIVMGGLLRRQDDRTIQKVPGLSALPIIGKLFTSTNYVHRESDVIFVMTPEVIAR